MSQVSQKRNQEKHLWEKLYPVEVDYYAELTPQRMDAVFDEAAQKFSEKNHLDFLGKKYTYAETFAFANKAAKGLQAMGIKKGDRVGLFLPNCPYFPIFYYAILKIGAVAVNYNPLYAKRELAHQIKDSDTKFMVTLDLKATYDTLHDLQKDGVLENVIVCKMSSILPFPKNYLFPLLKGKDIAKVESNSNTFFFDRIIDNDGQYTPVDVDIETHPAVLQYTGGTTGVPKGAVLTHKNLSVNVRQLRLWFFPADEGNERVVAVIPFFHVFAMTVLMNMPSSIGAEIYMMPRFDINDTLKLLHKSKATVFAAVPTIYNAINAHPQGNKYDLTSLKACMSGGAPLPVETKHIFEEKTGCTVVEGYGLTESSPVALANPLSGENRHGSIGLPMPGTIIEIVSLEDGESVMPIGEKGEVCLSGPQIMLEYWNKPEETAKTIRNGRLHTGDVAYIDEDGYTYIVDRIKDVILAGGYNIYPRNVEEAIYLHPAVEECVVAGIPDEYRGQTVKAYIKIQDGNELTQDELVEFLKDKLSKIEIPKIVEFRDDLPKTMIGKLSRKDLLDEEKAKLKK